MNDLANLGIDFRLSNGKYSGGKAYQELEWSTKNIEHTFTFEDGKLVKKEVA